MLKSTRPHRNYLRINAALDIVGSTARLFNQDASIVPKIGSAIVSGVHACDGKAKKPERLIQAIIAFIAIFECVALVIAAVQQETCTMNGSVVCQLVLFSDLVYQGCLLGSWGLSELVKEDMDPVGAVELMSYRSAGSGSESESGEREIMALS